MRKNRTSSTSGSQNPDPAWTQSQSTKDGLIRRSYSQRERIEKSLRFTFNISHEDAQDAVAKAWHELATSLQEGRLGCRDDNHLRRMWVKRATQRALDILRRSPEHAVNLDFYGKELVARDEFGLSDLKTDLQSALQKMRRIDREVILMQIQGLTDVQIASSLSLESDKAVQMARTRARATLRKLLGYSS